MQETKHIYQAINAIQKIVAKEGLAKERSNKEQGYKFRGIDDVLNLMSPLLAEQGICTFTSILKSEVSQYQTKSGTMMNRTVVSAQIRFIDITDGSTESVEIVGEASDSADKATNKAMSAAYKYAMILTFNIPVIGEENEGDFHTPEEAVTTKETTLQGGTSQKDKTTDDMVCPKCSSAMWDNRTTKKGNQPDYKCRNKTCGNGVWLKALWVNPNPGVVTQQSNQEEPTVDYNGDIPF